MVHHLTDRASVRMIPSSRAVLASSITGLLLLAATLLTNVHTRQVQLLQRSAPAAGGEFAVTVPPSWQPGRELAVTVPGHGQVLMLVPEGVQRGQSFLISVGNPQVLQPAAASVQSLAQQAPQLRPQVHTKTGMLDDLSFDGMLDFERKIRDTMGKLRHTWQSVPKLNILKGQVSQGSMLAAQEFGDAKFISVNDVANKTDFFSKKNPYGFYGGPPNANNTNGVPGWTFTTDGETLGVKNQGPGYYQLKDPEHNEAYMRMLRLDCFGSNAKWRDHSNCAALLKRSHTYANADMFRFSGAFGWNPPFPPGKNATNVQGAMAPNPNQYWNYGSDDDFAGARMWDGKKFVPPPVTTTAPATTPAP